MNDFEFGNFITELRLEKGLSQAELGSMLGVTNKSVSKWENGSAKPNTKLLPLIADIFNISVEELLLAKHIEKDSEKEKISLILKKQKRKFAFLSSLFGVLLLTVPFYLIEFIIIINGFNLPDDVAGPLGSVIFIQLFIISLVLYIVYSVNFKKALYPKTSLYSDREARMTSISLKISFALLYFVLVLSLPLALRVAVEGGLRVAIYFLLASFTLAVFITGAIVFLLNIRKKLCIRSSVESSTSKDNSKRSFKDLPTFIKVCFILCAILFPIYISGMLYRETTYPIGLAFHTCLIIISTYNLTVSLQNKKKK